MIPYGQHFIDNADIDAVVDVLENHFLTQGAKVPEFEQALCDYTGAEFCTSVNSATSGLHVACLAAGVEAGDIVWTVPNSFAASANCALYCGASVDFVDIDADTFNISLSALRTKLDQAVVKNCLPKALVVVHFAGQTCDMKAIHSMLSPYNICIIEDAAHGLGASYGNKKVGACEYSQMAVFSFHPVKSITTAEGGAVMTNSEDLDRQLKLYSKHGITRETSLMQGTIDGPWHYQQLVLGYNYRLNDLQAALGISQLQKLDEFIQKRQQLAARYLIELKGLPLQLPLNDGIKRHSWHLFMVVLQKHMRASIYQRLHEKGIGVNVHYIPIHSHPFYQTLGFKKGDFPASEHFYNNALTLPLYPSMTHKQQTTVINVLRDLLSD